MNDEEDISEELKWEEHHKIWDKFQEKHNLDGCWCIDDTYPEQEHNLPHNIIQYDSYWTKQIYKATIKGNTWGDVYIACAKIIKECNDHHPFIEILSEKDGYMNLHTGS